MVLKGNKNIAISEYSIKSDKMRVVHLVAVRDYVGDNYNDLYMPVVACH